MNDTEGGRRDSDPSLTRREGSEKFIGSGDTAKRSNIGDDEASHTRLDDKENQPDKTANPPAHKRDDTGQ